MKRILVSLAFALALTGAVMAQGTGGGLNLQQNAPSEVPAFKWESNTTHDFGKIPQGTPASTTFEFVNNGSADLVLSNVKPSCGCTTPEYTKEPIPKGGKGYIKATYNAAGAGVFNKSITVTSNAGDPVVLYIKGEVQAKDNPTPTMPATVPAPPVAKADPIPAAKPLPAAVTTPTKSDVLVSQSTQNANVFFETGSSTVSAKDYKELDKIVAEMTKNTNTFVLVNGYASKIGKASVNQKLSEARANKVTSYLTSKGIAKDRIITQYFGDTQTTATGNANNERRVEVIVVNK